MKKPVKALVPVFLAAFLASTPVLGQTDGPPSEPSKDQVNYEKLKETLDKLNESLNKLNENNTTTNVQIQKINSEIDKLKTRLDQLEKAVRDQSDGKRVSKFGPETAEGIVILKNDYLQNMQFIVNGVSYTLRPGEDREVKVPGKTFTFSVPAVPGFQVTQTRTLTDRPYEIRIYPQ